MVVGYASTVVPVNDQSTENIIDRLKKESTYLFFQFTEEPGRNLCK